MEFYERIKQKCQEVRKLNQLKIIDDNHLLCSFCDSWLQNPIYKFSNDRTYCGPCNSQLNGGITRDTNLEELLPNLLYPCLHCEEYKGALDLVIHHMTKCQNAPLLCPERVCQIQMRDYTTTTIFDHLNSFHDLKILQIHHPKFQITFEGDTRKKFYLVKLQPFTKNYIIQLEKITPCEFQVSIGTSSLDSTNNTKFIAKLQNQQKLKIKQKLTQGVGTMVDFLSLLNDSILYNHKAKLYMTSEEGSYTTFNFEISLGTALICSQNCRLQSSLESNNNRNCKFANYGCLNIDIRQHRRSCEYLEVSCEICEVKCTKSALFKHMQEDHGNETIDLNQGSVSFQSFNGDVFYCKARRKGTEVRFNVRLLRVKSREDQSHENYRYELHFNNGNEDDEFSLGNSCQDFRDFSTSSIVNLDEKFFKNKKNVGCKLLIFHVKN